jgi:hypothetical protein
MHTLTENSPKNQSEYTADREFERQFHLMFPYLKVSLKKVSSGRNATMITNPAVIITENASVKELCDRMLERYGREVKVLRYTINTWLPVKQSKHWTLKSQNDEARKLSCLNPDL